ncbi:MAG TPA: prepilin-type N-terminal cleavage/methylation domain-containing protein [Candidatus Syntrophosphaera sp.]|jgi:prepilin-type N-terminal cleavage/methylation domain-containing protein|nr:prepilin-type N-terminal cleavage/methylation domain-containing protein [Candidatus Cloacimonadota bacterium]HOR02946.1 prepilin-type N-terminal cleavage/methylation domain-containing protein [Candidatus Syntrophosphaera sp.]HPK82877.1 prepilin-type N-terminal cleavage/methylation domain-containing protein [Candidatus Syntrophosphaera sp.]HQK29162.1 prepilin-type N-terminal cleavage/methylation domain-containing protein [Candidatus Syntrophosphaera sp.]HQO68471.1 prepilin-type N-terminal cle
MNTKRTFANSILGRQRGVTLAELVVVMAISVILIFAAALGIGTFFRKYRELTAWAELQKDALDCLNLIKNGVPVGNAQDMEYYGVANALNMRLLNTTTNSSTDLRIIPPTDKGLETLDYAQFYLYDGAVRCRYVHRGVQVASPLYIFPKKENLGEMIVDKFLFTKVNPDQDVLVLQVELHARVKTGANRYRSVKFTTKMAKK